MPITSKIDCKLQVNVENPKAPIVTRKLIRRISHFL